MMSFKSLVVLLLLAGSLSAQNNCQIVNLTATLLSSAPSSCEYGVMLNFGHTGTSNQFTVSGNGIVYGTFPYSQVPVVLGPFTAGATPTVKEFIVQDAVFPDCKAQVTVTIPACNQAGVCNIYDATVQTGPCDPVTNTYKVWVNFEVTNPGNDFFEVWTGNGQSLGIYPIAQLPVMIPNYPSNGNPTDALKICINDQPNCCEWVEFSAPDCTTPFCPIENLTAIADSCTSDSTYRVKINFLPGALTVVDTFDLFANGNYFGSYPTTQLPLVIDDFPWNGGPADVVKVCIETPNVTCCKEVEYQVPDCLPIYPCGIQNFSVETGECTSDSTFKLWVKFTVNDTSAVDSFKVWANGAFFGEFALSQIPLWIDSFPWNGLVFNQIRICTGNTPTCCVERQFVAPDCLPFGPCEILPNITAIPGPCTSDSTYRLRLNFQATNPGNKTFGLYVNNNLFGTYSLFDLPLTINNFPWGGSGVDVVTICINGISPNTPPGNCCRTIEVNVPDCIGGQCDISNLTVQTGQCTSNDTYQLYLDFDVVNPPSQKFVVYANDNPQPLGLFDLNQLPLMIPNFPTNGGPGDYVKICMVSDNTASAFCCVVADFPVPDCIGGDCDIYDLVVDPGDCTSDSTYSLFVNFQVSNPPGNTFGVWANGEFFGTFNLNQLPLQIPNFPSDGGPNDVIKICFTNSASGQQACCAVKEFPVPDCIGGDCDIYDLAVDPGNCTSDSTYSLFVNFQVSNPPGNTFGVWANGEFFGTFNLNQLPLQIPNFPSDGGPNDLIKICFTNSASGQQACCAVKEFPVPDCIGGDCEIYDLAVDPGDCTSDSTYSLFVNFQVSNPTGNTFGVWANGEFFGTFNLNQLPLQIPNFPSDGGPNDVIKICFTNSASGQQACCAVKEFPVPDCIGGDCEIYDLAVDPGSCTSDSTYSLFVNFQVSNPPGNTFGVWANGMMIGTFNLNQLPLQIPNFPANGNAQDIIKICFLNSGAVGCCRELAFQGPNCNDDPCSINNLAVQTGDCTSDSTYQLWVNFNVSNPPSNNFGVWANDEFLGIFSLNQLPLPIPNFPWNGGSNDVIKVCFGNGGIISCCAIKEFAVPDCLGQGGPCTITNLKVETGDCTSDSTYEAWVNFEVDNAFSNQFTLWANGEVLGVFNLNQLPLYIPNFPWNGGNNDVVKVCIQGNAPNLPICCAIKEFDVPDCMLNDPCSIYDLAVLKTPCLCGQFFAILTFEHQNGGNGGFEILGNGVNYGTFPYNHPQPIILGPLDGDATTDYEFIVRDVQFPDCGDEVALGKVECATMVVSPNNGGGQLNLSPNPTDGMIQVSARFDHGARAGQTRVEIYHADGRMVQAQTVADGNNFPMDVTLLPAGVYRMSLRTEAGNAEGTFVKQ